jgi:parvulin-like peptidyl-prolyl isomerase
MLKMEYKLLEQLSKYGLLTDFLKSKVLENKIKDINLSEFEKAEARDHYIKFFSLKNELLIEEHRKKNLLSKENLLYRMNLNKKVQKYCEDKYDEFIGKEYLSNKEKLDMVKYSMIRVKEYGLAMELYLKIKDDNEDFNELAKKYSIGIEKKTNGVIGLLPLERVNNIMRPKLSKNNLNFINKPFKYNNEWIICRLDEYKESKLDKNTVMNLKSKILDEEIEREIINCYTNDLNTLLN